MILYLIIILNLLSIIYAVRKERYDIADVLWGLNILMFCLYFFNLNKGFEYEIGGLIAIYGVIIWGLRLFFHIGQRFFKKSKQDQRYIDLLKKSKNSFFKVSKVFILQIILAFLMSASFWNSSISSLSSWNIVLGIIIFIIGFGFEVISDYQLKKFIKDPKNKGSICQAGLYSISRHPNYFGEVLLWWGVWLINGYTLIGFISPILISFLILKVSGIPMSEKYLSKKKGFKDYASKTNLFIPWKRKVK